MSPSKFTSLFNREAVEGPFLTSPPGCCPGLCTLEASGLMFPGFARVTMLRVNSSGSAVAAAWVWKGCVTEHNRHKI
jgi:hypothetical protein